MQYLYKKNFFTFLFIELLSIFAVLSFRPSFIYFIVLAAINILIFLYLHNYLIKYTNKSISTKQIYNQYNSGNLNVGFIFGILLLVISFFIPIHFYFLGTSFLIFSLIQIIFRKNIIKISNRLGKLSYYESRKIFLDRSFFTVTFLALIPLIVDLHYNILSIPNNLYFLVVISYSLIITMIQIYSIIKNS